MTTSTHIDNIDGVNIKKFELEDGEKVAWGRRVKRLDWKGPTGVLIITTNRLVFCPSSNWIEGMGTSIWEVKLDQISKISAEKWSGNMLFSSANAGVSITVSPIVGKVFDSIVKSYWLSTVRTKDGQVEYFNSLPNHFNWPTKESAEQLSSEMNDALDHIK
ncbi:hypothetical protein [Haladaptatus sp. AB643]|uniref:hypothetical protein n=1 Tax=Haladaptatus sp. AB643 TaxID=2934174 RepID=UPI00209C4C58|nr:hypothetical protein [Haladaptatus sp. AB643]MCO8242997.1 hypothetical protein [Haladaptatus sp. AB643]